MSIDEFLDPARNAALAGELLKAEAARQADRAERESWQERFDPVRGSGMLPYCSTCGMMTAPVTPCPRTNCGRRVLG